MGGIDNSQSVGRKKVFIIAGGIVIIIAVVLIMLLTGLLRLPWWNAAPSLPKDLILESNARKSYFKNNTIQLTQFTTSKTTQELVNFYADKLSTGGWRITGQGTIPGSSDSDVYTLIAVQSEKGLNLNIFIKPLSGGASSGANTNLNQVSLSIKYTK